MTLVGVLERDWRTTLVGVTLDVRGANDYGASENRGARKAFDAFARIRLMTSSA